MPNNASAKDGTKPERGSEYDELTPTFAALAAAKPGSEEHTRLRVELVARCTPLADNIARRFSGRGEPLDDLTQVARVGLLNAIDRFDAERGSSFLSFAVPTIMGEVRRHFRDSTWAMRVPRRVKETRQRIDGAINVLAQQLGRSPTASEIAAELSVDTDEIAQALIASSAYQPTSIDAALSSTSESESALLDTLGEDEPRYERIEEYLAIRPLISALPSRERAILTMRFFDSLTQTQIAQRLGISQMHVSRILSKTLTRLREQSGTD